MVFGEGVFGPSGVVWCCTITVLVPALYMMVWTLGKAIPNGGWIGSGLLTIVLSFIGAGYLFGDAVGLLVASVVILLVVPTLKMGPRRVYTRVQTIKPKRMALWEDGEVFEIRQDK